MVWPLSGPSSGTPSWSPDPPIRPPGVGLSHQFGVSCGRSCGRRTDLWGNPPRNWGIPRIRLIRMPGHDHHACTPNTARGSGTGEPTIRPRQELRLRSREEGREPGEAPETCSGRTATTLAPRGTSGSATGTRVSRPGGMTRSLRANRRATRTRPRPEPDHCRSLCRRRATGSIDGGTGIGVPSRSGRSIAVGRRSGTVDQGSVGNRWSSRVRERSVDGCSGSGSEPDPSGLGSGSGSSDGTVRQVDVRRRGGSEELTGSPGGYSGPLSRFRTASAGPWSGPGCGITGRRTPTRPWPPATPSPSPRRP